MEHRASERLETFKVIFKEDEKFFINRQTFSLETLMTNDANRMKLRNNRLMVNVTK